MSKRYIQAMLDSFLKLPRRAQELFFEDLDNDAELIIAGKKSNNSFVSYALSDAFDTSGTKNFSGSQIYADPFKCADEVFAYCKKKVGAK